MTWLLNGNALALPIASGVVQCVVTSPPYWLLRDYQVSGQLGSEPLHDCLGWARGENCGRCYVCHMRQVFAEVWRVLHPDGTVWLNLGDSYNGSGGAGGDYADGGLKAGQPKYSGRNVSSLKPKDLVGIPWRVAFALQADGWYLRSDIIWAKPNPMPESVTDRPTKAHEYLFLLAKSQRYYYDAEAVKETQTGEPRAREFGNKNAEARCVDKLTGNMAPGVSWIDTGTRNRRTVWNIATSPYSGAHFATFPPKLVEPCILAGTSERGQCPTCGKPWERVVERPIVGYSDTPRYSGNGDRNDSEDGRTERASVTLGWQPACTCPPADPMPQIVMDIFSGTATVGMVATKHRRHYVGVELKPEYIELARERTAEIQMVMI